MARLARRGGEDRRAAPCPVPHREAARARHRARPRRPPDHSDAVHQHDPAAGPVRGVLVPRRRVPRASHPGVHPVERRGHGHQGEQARRRDRRPPRHLRLVGGALRRRLQLVLAGQGRRPGRRRHLHPGPRRPRHLRPIVPGGSDHRGRARRVPSRDRRCRALVVPPPPTHARVLGVPHRLDGPRSDQLDLPGSVQPVPAPPPARRHQPRPGVVLRRRRRDRRARDARLDPPRRP